MSSAVLKKGEDASESLRRENLELRRQVAKLTQDNKLLKAQLNSVSVMIDKAKQAGFLVGSYYDVKAGLEMTKAISMQEPSPGTHGESDTSAVDTNRTDAVAGDLASAEKRRFQLRWEFEDHEGSVFSARFDPGGTLVASGSFDKTVRVFNVYKPEEKVKMTGHSMMVSSISWAPDTSALASASFDSTCRLWDVSVGCCTAEFSSQENAFLLATAWHATDTSVFLASSSNASVYWYDKRSAPKAAQEVQHSCMVNSIQALRGGQVVLGDKFGCITTWDPRMLSQHVARTDSPDLPETPRREVSSSSLAGPATPSNTIVQRGAKLPGTASSFQATTAKAQVSHVCTPSTGPEDEQDRFLAVNAYDNILRIYDRNSLTGDQGVDTSEPKLACKLMAQEYRNQGFPIQSSFWVGETAYGKVKPIEERTWPDSMLLATGSCAATKTEENMTCPAYVFDVTDIRRGGSGVLLQKLQEHSDIVYGVHFHPKQPLMVTYSADSTVKMWSIKGFS
ncbi:putative WD repeat-containing protein K04G11.4 [Diplonema papillatum]|nr:putative WD repeat-containing protein K04G11.4 [Diplonema papillatum]